MKKILLSLGFILILTGTVLLVAVNRDAIYKYYIKNIDPERKNITITTNDNYSIIPLIYNIKITDNFIATDKNHLSDIFYTIINSGNSKFTFYCDPYYEKCISDVEELINNDEYLAIVNDVVHPYNSFKSIKIEYSTAGKVVISISKNYTEEEINIINTKANEILNKTVTISMTNKERIKVLHDYIINNTNYDKERADKGNSSYSSYTAYGVLIEGYGICSGYADSMMIFLHKLNILNYKISNSKHVWNYLKLDNSWQHLDLTWDDPITYNGKNVIKYYYFLIDNNKLDKLNTGSHNYNKEIYAK